MCDRSESQVVPQAGQLVVQKVREGDGHLQSLPGTRGVGLETEVWYPMEDPMRFRGGTKRAANRGGGVPN